MENSSNATSWPLAEEIETLAVLFEARTSRVETSKSLSKISSIDTLGTTVPSWFWKLRVYTIFPLLSNMYPGLIDPFGYTVLLFLLTMETTSCMISSWLSDRSMSPGIVLVMEEFRSIPGDRVLISSRLTSICLCSPGRRFSKFQMCLLLPIWVPTGSLLLYTMSGSRSNVMEPSMVSVPMFE